MIQLVPKGDPKGDPKWGPKGDPKGIQKGLWCKKGKPLWDGEILLMLY